MSFMDTMQFRHACKAFDENKTVTKQQKNQIIEFGRLSPSSFGFEPWHFLVISNKALRKKIRPACWNQVQITSSAFIVIFLTRQPYHFRPDNQFYQQHLSRKSPNEEVYKQFSQRVLTFLAEQSTAEWAKRQTYIALANMLTGAASLGIDSCPIEGFNSEALKGILKDEVDWSVYSPAVIAAFGYRLNEQPPKIRQDLDKIATFIE